MMTENHLELIDRLVGDARRECLGEPFQYVVQSFLPIDALSTLHLAWMARSM